MFKKILYSYLTLNRYCSCCLKQKRSTTSGNISLKSSKMNKKRFWFFWKKKKIALTRPLYRDDIFYEKSLDTVNLQRRSTMTYSSHRRLDQTSYVVSKLRELGMHLYLYY